MSDVVNLLCIRDPDSENEYVSDGLLREITIDIGSQWADYRDFCVSLQEEDPEAVDFERELLSQVADLDTDNPVRQRVVEFFADARRD